MCACVRACTCVHACIRACIGAVQCTDVGCGDQHTTLLHANYTWVFAVCTWSTRSYIVMAWGRAEPTLFFVCTWSTRRPVYGMLRSYIAPVVMLYMALCTSSVGARAMRSTAAPSVPSRLVLVHAAYRHVAWVSVMFFFKVFRAGRGLRFAATRSTVVGRRLGRQLGRFQATTNRCHGAVAP